MTGFLEFCKLFSLQVLILNFAAIFLTNSKKTSCQASIWSTRIYDLEQTSQPKFYNQSNDSKNWRVPQRIFNWNSLLKYWLYPVVHAWLDRRIHFLKSSITKILIFLCWPQGKWKFIRSCLRSNSFKSPSLFQLMFCIQNSIPSNGNEINFYIFSAWLVSDSSYMWANGLIYRANFWILTGNPTQSWNG